jgi:hypothetical protein
MRRGEEGWRLPMRDVREGEAMSGARKDGAVSTEAIPCCHEFANGRPHYKDCPTQRTGDDQTECAPHAKDVGFCVTHGGHFLSGICNLAPRTETARACDCCGRTPPDHREDCPITGMYDVAVLALRAILNRAHIPYRSEGHNPIWHFMPTPGVAECGSDYPNMSKTADHARVTCIVCLHRIGAERDKLRESMRAIAKGIGRGVATGLARYALGETDEFGKPTDCASPPPFALSRHTIEAFGVDDADKDRADMPARPAGREEDAQAPSGAESSPTSEGRPGERTDETEVSRVQPVSTDSSSAGTDNSDQTTTKEIDHEEGRQDIEEDGHVPAHEGGAAAVGQHRDQPGAAGEGRGVRGEGGGQRDSGAPRAVAASSSSVADPVVVLLARFAVIEGSDRIGTYWHVVGPSRNLKEDAERDLHRIAERCTANPLPKEK